LPVTLTPTVTIAATTMNSRRTLGRMSDHHAACSCGQLSLLAQGDPVRVSMCHCLACQRRTGSAFGVQARYLRDRVQIEGDATAYTRISDEGDARTFHFCPHCGATVFYHLPGEEDVVAIPVGAFAEPGFPAPTRSVYEARRHEWVAVPAAIEHYD
jgi:hypothetical protein